MAYVRVTRIMEYTYDDVNHALMDQQRWVVQGTKVFGKTVIKSTTLPADIFLGDDKVDDEVDPDGEEG